MKKVQALKSPWHLSQVINLSSYSILDYKVGQYQLSSLLLGKWRVLHEHKYMKTQWKMIRGMQT